MIMLLGSPEERQWFTVVQRAYLETRRRFCSYNLLRSQYIDTPKDWLDVYFNNL